LPHAGHGTRQPAGWLGPVQTGRTCTSPGTRGGAKAPGLGTGAPWGASRSSGSSDRRPWWR
jgi:hypothetical protein